jgi:hypothetical protein
MMIDNLCGELEYSELCHTFFVNRFGAFIWQNLLSD